MENLDDFLIFDESLKELYTTIKFLNTQNPLKLITIASAMNGEGKTSINISLAKTIAETGSKVLLIDANLRNSTIHQKIGIKNKLGLSDLLISQKSNWNNYLNQVKGFDNFDVLTSGSAKFDSKLLNNQNLKKLFSELKTSDYDLILIDTPSINLFSDTL